MPGKMTTVTSNQLATFQITVRGGLDQNWMHYFQGITMDFDGEVTTLNGIVADQSALRGLLCYLWDFNLTILSVVLNYPEGHHSGEWPRET